QAELAEMESLALHGVDVCEALRRAVTARADAAPQIRELDAVDAKLLALSARNIAGFLIQPLIHGISDEGERRPDPDEVITRSTAMYQGIADSAGLQRSLIARAAADLARPR
ncbi:MAG TPA: hypothetical protein VHE79_12660, partial [Spirochaetia bacterium]